MNAEHRASDLPEHDPAEATRWFNQWHVYRSIVDHDWMCHRGIFTALTRYVLLRHPGPFSLLDLGCGDGSFINRTFADTGLWSYTGIDASQTALAKARAELANARFEVRLVEADMLAFLRGHAGNDRHTFDVLLTSYAAHHLPTPEKREFFRQAVARLAPGGTLLYGDIFRRAGESREQYLDAYLSMMRNEWQGLAPEDLASTSEHVTQRDFPESVETVREMAREAGFRHEPQELFSDATGFHRLFAFGKER